MSNEWIQAFHLSLAEVLPRLTGVRKSGGGFVGRCPAHNDKNPSLSIGEKDGRLLLYCHAGCTFEAVMSAIGNGHASNGNGKSPSTLRTANSGLEKSNITSNGGRRLASRRSVAEYDYTDRSGYSAFTVVRYELLYDDDLMEKSFVARRRPRNGEMANSDGWVYNIDGIELVPYRLPALLDADLVYVVEGEKDVETLGSIGFTATCNPFGAGKWRPEFNPWFKDKVVVILPDNDEAGAMHAESVARSLVGVAKETLIINLPGLPPKGDVTDFIENGGTADDLIDLVQRAEPWERSGTPVENGPLSKFVFTALTDLLNEPKEEVAYLWENTLPTGGFSICSAKPKVGKSTLARNLAVAVAKGELFLGRSVKRGLVLYLCLEEKRSEITNHFRRMGINSDQILVYTGPTPEDALKELRIAIAEYDPDLVIVDPLSRVLRIHDFNDYAAMSRGLEPFVDLARTTGCHILALHHDSKMERTEGTLYLVQPLYLRRSIVIFSCVNEMELERC